MTKDGAVASGTTLETSKLKAAVEAASKLKMIFKLYLIGKKIINIY